MLMPRGQPGGCWAQLELTDAELLYAKEKAKETRSHFLSFLILFFLFLWHFKND